MTAFYLAALIALPSICLQYLIVVKYGLLDLTANSALNFRIYAVFFTPVVEESFRYAAVWWAKRGGRFAEPSFATAALIGFIVGLIEFVAKSIDIATVPAQFWALYLFLNSSSLIIHTALSCAFFSFRSHRLLKTMGLHALLNFMLVVADLILGGLNLGMRASPLGYTAGTTAVLLAASLCLILMAAKRMGFSPSSSKESRHV
jgi:hypothetical protein